MEAPSVGRLVACVSNSVRRLYATAVLGTVASRSSKGAARATGMAVQARAAASNQRRGLRCTMEAMAFRRLIALSAVTRLPQRVVNKVPFGMRVEALAPRQRAAIWTSFGGVLDRLFEPVRCCSRVLGAAVRARRTGGPSDAIHVSNLTRACHARTGTGSR
jgi:hypothetical protein